LQFTNGQLEASVRPAPCAVILEAVCIALFARAGARDQGSEIGAPTVVIG